MCYILHQNIFMQKHFIALLAFLFVIQITSAQSDFNYTIELEAISIPGLQGLHSYAFAQHDGKWLIIGGRKDGLHARQRFNAFPAAQNNTEIYVIDANSKQFWTASLNSLTTGIKEQLQSTNMSFTQSSDTLYIVGGYAFSATANNHITFPNLATVNVSGLINAVINGTAITSFFKQITDNRFAVTGSQLGKIGNTFYLVGGHKFDGQYNPMGNPTYTQTYTNEIRKFEVNNSDAIIVINNYNTISDAVHLHRRDYNLLPQIFPDGSEGFTISSGVFQPSVDLPYLYPVDIKASGIDPITSFNQYLSNYHGAKACLYDSVSNSMHNLFFGGMSQYYYQNGALVQDNNVPFVKTISRLTRSADGTLTEYQLPIEMPGLKGASAEFIPNHNLPHFPSEIIKLSRVAADTILIGHIYGGLLSPWLNPFTDNQTTTTSADNAIYAVRLIKNEPTGISKIDGHNPYSFDIFPNPSKQNINISYTLKSAVKVNYYVATIEGKIIKQGWFENNKLGRNNQTIELNENIGVQTVFITIAFDYKFFDTKKAVIKP